MLGMVAPPSTTKWSDRLAFDVALALEGSGETMAELRERYGISDDALTLFKQDRVFLRRVADYRVDVRERGLTFRVKARAQAEELLSTSWLMIHDADVSPAVRADLIKSTVRWAGLQDIPDGTDGGGGAGVRINIVLGGASDPAPRQPVVIDG